MLTRAEEAKLVAENMETVRKCVRKYAGYGVDEADLVQEGMIGLLNAIRSFDPSKGASLSTWANFYIRGQVRAALGLGNGSDDKQRKRDRRENSKQSNYRPLGQSLDAPVKGEGDTEMHDVIASDAPTPEDECAQAEAYAHARKAVTQAIRVLKPAELDVICDRFDNDVTLQEIGDRRGVTRERARQIEASGIARMRKVLRA